KSLLSKKEMPLKVLADGDITKALTVKAVKFSAAARAKIEAAGGSCIEG
ncbi:MAG: uL15 family ribosomal protein, partial [Lentisphaeria bacterium]|nr:uL15 family ribosomal protein [Lentisphaeria bacterium]